MRSLMEKDSHLLYGSAVMIPTMRMQSLFLFFHKTYYIRIWLFYAFPCLHRVICTGFHRTYHPITSWVLICGARLHVLGYDIYISQESSCNSDSDVSELYAKPVQLVWGNELLDKNLPIFYMRFRLYISIVGKHLS